MANKGHIISIGADTGAYEKGIKSGVIEPTENASAALADLGKQDTGQLEQEIKSAQRATENLADEIKDARAGLDRMGRSARDAGSDAKRGMRDAEDGVKEFKEEATSTAREAAASFDGSAASIGDAFQEVAANAFGGFGPAGKVAGIAAALGIGGAAAGFEAVSRAEEESRQRAADWAQAFAEAGTKVLTSASAAAMGVDIATDSEKFKTAQTNAKNWGVDISVAIAAMTGETWALEAANRALTEQENKAAEASVRQADGGEALADMLMGQTAHAREGRDALNQLTREMELGGQQFDALSGFLRAMAENTAGATTAVDEFGDSIVTLPDGKQIYIDAETGRATDKVDAIKNQIYSVPEGHHTTLTVSAELAQAEAQLNAFLNRDLTKVVDVVVNTFSNLGGKMY